jgi:hypothetical protein
VTSKPERETRDLELSQDWKNLIVAVSQKILNGFYKPA